MTTAVGESVADRETFMRAALANGQSPTLPAGKRKYVGPPAAIVAFADWRYYYTRDVLAWKSNTDANRAVSVPIGFVTDLASIPSLFWSILPRTAAYSYPAIVHDYLYWAQPCERKEADDIFNLAMSDVQVDTPKRLSIYQAVRLAGGTAWAANTGAKARGERRILKLFPTDVTTTWEQWKANPNVFVQDGAG
jgi:hypothetical protein